MTSEAVINNNACSEDVFISRQPIYDHQMSVVGYELLYQSFADEDAAIDFDDATTEVLINSLIEIGLANIAEDKPAFVSISPKYLLGELPIALETDHVVLQISEAITNADQLSEQLQQLQQQSGFSLALDNFAFNSSSLAAAALADYIKIDISRLSQEELQQQLALLQPLPAKLVAEQVATQSDYQRCKELGFDLFQGYFFCEPNIIKGQRTPSSRLAILHLLAELQNPDVSFDDVEQLVAKDVSLSYRLLRYINSALYSLPRKVDSLRQAITILGLRAIKTWVTIIAQSKFDDKPYELMITSLIRARMCELLAQALQFQHDSVFVVGLFSTLDALLDKPMEEVLEQLPLTEEVNHAILYKDRTLGQILKYVIAYEQADWCSLPEIGIDNQTAKSAYLEAIQWTRQVGEEILSES